MSERMGRWAAVAAVLGLAVALATPARADAGERQRRLASPMLGVVGLQGLGLLREPAPAGSDAIDGGGVLSLALAEYELKGAQWRVVSLDRLAYRVDASAADIALTLFELDHFMIGRDVDDRLCLPALLPMFWGDCMGDSGLFGLRALLLQHAHDFDSGRWFHRWAELALLVDPLRDSFDEPGFRHRLPIELGVSLDQVANTVLPDGSSSRLMPRAVAGARLLLRDRSYRWELVLSGAYRPGLRDLPDALSDDYGVEARLRIGYLFLARLLGSHRETLQRVVLDGRYGYWKRPELAPEAERSGAPHLLEITLGFVLSLREIEVS